MTSTSPPPASPDGWIEICDRELTNLSRGYRVLSNDAKIGHALAAVEATLKAIIWKHERWAEWPMRRNKDIDFLYRHNIEIMIDRCGLRTRLLHSKPHRASWNVIVNASVKQYRYSNEIPSDADTNAVVKCVRHPDNGVVPWLKEYYLSMRLP